MEQVGPASLGPQSDHSPRLEVRANGGIDTIRRAPAKSARESLRGSGRWCREGGAEPAAADRGSPTSSPGSLSLRRRGLRRSLLAGLWITAAAAVPPPGKAEEAEDEQEEAAWLALEPAEHEWMLAAAEGDYAGLEERLRADPSLVSRRDFVTGYSALHWLAKHGRHEDLIRLLDFARGRGLPLDVDAPARGGLTPLHLAAAQGHDLLLKVLIGAFGADVHRRDHSGRRAWQYLRAGAPPELRELAGAPERDEEAEGSLAALNSNNNCRRRQGHGETEPGPPAGLPALRAFLGRALSVFRSR
ncbi:ankyrin repeat domain-containing protein SOWAHD [Rhinatrema bivittatum]|uniref:ankyrin repeat domain-containing protein SOWAHD n=1 Tax=Rhinatrema bivittatum TaxID=194408 RepID=UPI0011267505|nr:ankyrin repeat domain-containing protein SOWAHD [Rhinatrema bivittatum]XP_029463685.1 ankyrin repeat domain-containing protein SOWAHD [Rhinatrema bivittatum]XP_029463686.1 ankyrin repeat domain-containing protein SOWAHD [Rhinatrema bivittatum]